MTNKQFKQLARDHNVSVRKVKQAYRLYCEMLETNPMIVTFMILKGSRVVE